MAMRMEDLRVLQAAERVADGVWREVSGWNEFARDTVGKQVVRAVDSIGANVAEAFGRYHYGEKLQFLYYARGSLFETKYWLNRSQARNLINSDVLDDFMQQLATLAQQLNGFIRMVKNQRSPHFSKTVQEHVTDYTWLELEDEDALDDAMKWLESHS